MKKYLAHICWLVITLPVLGTAQTTAAKDVVSFYTHLAERDALNEQNLLLVNKEDHDDFWKDQNDFENLLAEQNPEGYRIYLKEKGRAYRQHQKECGEECQHTEHYLNKAAFYAINGQLVNRVVYAPKKRKPQVED